ncbi:MAG: pilus assembly protein PilM [Casimicrobiaceae bacterium]
MANRELTPPSLAPRMHELARQLGLAGFWAWWMAQLDQLVPKAPRAALARRRMRTLIAFDGDHATLWRPVLEDGRAMMKAGTVVPLTGDAAVIQAAGRAAVASLAPMVYGGSSSVPRVVVAVPAREVLRKTIQLPAAVEEDLGQALTYDLDRHTPFKADELYFDAVVVRRDPTRGVVHIDLAAVRRAAVDPALKLVAAWGAEVVAVVPTARDMAAPSRVNLLPQAMRPSRSWWRRWQFWVPLAIFGLLVLAAILIPLWQKRDYAIQLNSLADQARAQAAISETLRLELDGKVADYNTALERKYAYPGALQTLDHVSKLLPDDTWLTQFELKGVTKGKEIQREILVRGETLNAGRLVQLFEDSQHFAQAAPRAPTTKIQPGPGEIFDLGAQLKPRAVPGRVALLVRQDPPDPAVPAVVAPGVPAAATAPGAATVTGGSAATPPAAVPVAPAVPATATPAPTVPGTVAPASAGPASAGPAPAAPGGAGSRGAAPIAPAGTATPAIQPAGASKDGPKAAEAAAGRKP